MRKIGLAVITALVLGFGMSGCGLFTQSQQKIDVSYVKDAACKGLQDITIFNTTKADYYLYNEQKRYTVSEKRLVQLAKEGFSILDYNSGKMESTRYTERKDRLPEVFYCDKIEVLNTISTDSKFFTMNGSGANDFKVKVVKEVYNAQKVKEGNVVAKNINITAYRLEPIQVVKYNDTLYPAGSPTYQKIKNLRDSLTCSTVQDGRIVEQPTKDGFYRTYCDGDLIKLEDNRTLMVKVRKKRDKVEIDVFEYDGGQPYQFSSNGYIYAIKDEGRGVVGNHNLKEYNMSDIYTLRLHELKTFKDW